MTKICAIPGCSNPIPDDADICRDCTSVPCNAELDAFMDSWLPPQSTAGNRAPESLQDYFEQHANYWGGAEGAG